MVQASREPESLGELFTFCRFLRRGRNYIGRPGGVFDDFLKPWELMTWRFSRRWASGLARLLLYSLPTAVNDPDDERTTPQWSARRWFAEVTPLPMSRPQSSRDRAG